MKSIRNFGIIAHVDAGKTTITEQMLFRSGELRKLGNVDNGTSVTDSLNVEKERGISVRAASVRFEKNNTVFNLIDTPGHGDFIGEVERSLSVLDGVIFVLSAAEGIEAQTPVLWHFLQTQNIPAIIFINKIDRMTSDVEKVIEDIQAELTEDFFMLQKPVNEATPEADIEILTDSNWLAGLTEKTAEHDDELLMRYLDGEKISKSEVLDSFKTSCKTGKLYPVLMGAAKSGIGIDELMKTVIDYLPEPVIKDNQLSAKIFKIAFDKSLGKLYYIRNFAGTIKPRDLLTNVSREIEEKVNQILIPRYNGAKMTNELIAGEVGIITGLKATQTGDWLGSLPDDEKPALNVSPFMVQVVAENPIDYTKLAESLSILNMEEPNLDFIWDREERTFSINVMGYIHIQILEQTIKDRFNISATLSEPEVIYKETPVKSAEGYDEYTMPKPCWAVCRFKIEPLETGSGVIFESKVSVDKIAEKYQKETSRAIIGALQQGILGWEVTDIKITLIDGEDHEIHSRPGNFTIATNIALMKALQKSTTTLLEPILNFSITIEEDKCGKIMSDIIKMRGSYEPPESRNGFSIIKGKVPAATSADYQLQLSSISGGKASFQTSFHGYEKCDNALGNVREYKGVNPLDRAKYILKMRGAVTESIKGS